VISTQSNELHAQQQLLLRQYFHTMDLLLVLDPSFPKCLPHLAAFLFLKVRLLEIKDADKYQDVAGFEKKASAAKMLSITREHPELVHDKSAVTKTLQSHHASDTEFVEASALPRQQLSAQTNSRQALPLLHSLTRP
jgi:hypothetical protein